MTEPPDLTRRLILTVLPALALAGAARGQDLTPKDMTMQPETSWRFFTDQVMGGVSTGRMERLTEEGAAFLRLSGQVSTENRGGFIQMRQDLAQPPAEGAQGVRVVVRGNDQRYFIHLRTAGTVLPWQYYQAGFEVTGTWAERRLPFGGFTASGALLARVPNPARLRSVALVAYGRDHAARLDLKEIGFY